MLAIDRASITRTYSPLPGQCTSNVKRFFLSLNENQKTETSTETDAFTVYGLNAAGEVVATASTNAIVVGDVTVELAAEGIVQVKVIMTDYFFNGTKCVNVSLGGVAVK